MSIETLPLTDLGSAAAAVVEKLKPRIIRHEPGVYFGMPDDEYHSDIGLGSTGLKNLLISPAVYWAESNYNPDRKPFSTRYTERGKGLHDCVLFGRETFLGKYAREPLVEDYPGALVTMDDMRAFLRARGLPTTAKRKEELAARIRENCDGYVIWDDVLAEVAASGKTILKAADYDAILTAAAMIRLNPSLENCFENGLPEVSVFWEDNGVRFRARFDYLRMNSIVDLKSFTNPMGKPIPQAIRSTFANRRHDIQASLYMTAREKARQFIREGRVFGEVDMDWLRALAEVDEYSFAFCYHLMDDNGAVVTQGKTIRPGGHIDAAASAQIARLADVWRENYARFGESMWVDLTPLEEFTEEDLPIWLGTR